MHKPRSIEDETGAPPECDREQFATRIESNLESDVRSSPTDDNREESILMAIIRSPVLPLGGVLAIGFVDWITSRSLGAHVMLSLLMAIPIYFAARVVGVRSGILTAAIGGSFCLVIDVLVLSTPEPRFFQLGLAATHLALYAAAVVLPIEHRRFLAERELAMAAHLPGVANRRGFHQTLTREMESSRRYPAPMTGQAEPTTNAPRCQR